MRLAAGAVLVVVAMSAVSVRGEEDLINWEKKRDPFAYDFREVIERPSIPPVDDFGIAKAREQLMSLYIKAECSLMDGHPDAALKTIDEGLAVITATGYPNALAAEHNKFIRLSTAAERAYEREAAEQDFKRLNLTLNGVVQSKQARAIINSKIVCCGEVIEFPNSSQSVMVTEIQKDKVIVRYRGFLMAVDLAEKG